MQLDMTVGPLFAALRQAAIVTDHESRGIDFTFADGTLKLEASTAEIGESQVELPIAYDGEPITLTMDHRYVADFCKVLDNETQLHHGDRIGCITGPADDRRWLWLRDHADGTRPVDCEPIHAGVLADNRSYVFRTMPSTSKRRISKPSWHKKRTRHRDPLAVDRSGEDRGFTLVACGR